MIQQGYTIGGFANAKYWSSTEGPFNSLVWHKNGMTGSEEVDPQNESNRVRAIRAF